MSQSNLAIQNVLAENKLAKHSVSVHKFGGSSLATPECILRAVDIIAAHCQLNDVVVVSANGKTTDKLIALYQQAVDKKSEFLTTTTELKSYQLTLINELLTADNAKKIAQQLNQDIEQIIQWLNVAPADHQAQTLAFGEVWSARLLAAILNERVCAAINIDARDFLVIDNEQSGQVAYSLSEKQFSLIHKNNVLSVVTGFIARDSEGTACTLGRNGSDYSATIMSALVQARNVTLWTDVDGIYSADPRIVPSARKLHRIENEVAQELGRLGNPILHAKTMQPLAHHQTHLHVASSFNKQSNGTEIGEFGQIAQQELSITHLNDVLLVQSSSINTAHKNELISLLAPLAIDCEQQLVVITPDKQKLMSQWLASHNTEVKFTPAAIIAVVGYAVAERGDVKAKFNRALKTKPPIALVKSTNLHSYIAIIADNCSAELVNRVHHKVTKNTRTIGVVVAGLGNIGQCFLATLPAQINRVAALENVHLVGLINSKKALINNDGLDCETAVAEFEQQALDYNEQQLLQWLSVHPYDDLIVVDITPSEQFSALYQAFFNLGIHVIGANKWAASSDTNTFNKLQSTASKHHSHWYGNATVGAGLPVNHAIQDLRNSGDSIVEISGIFSGTLSWLFENYQGNEAFSQLLHKALKQGITEPDPREDLSGKDVQRKLLILARAAGFTLSLDDIRCENLVPVTLQSVSKAEFLARANELDEFFAEQLQQAQQQQAKLRYVAQFSFNDGKLQATVGLQKLAITHPFSTISAGDNIFQIKSLWYQNNPLIIRGPGAGREVTAGALHSDLVNLCQKLVVKQPQVKIKRINS
jgi:aspartokinase/homoserine dehydrogenase 2